jgi:hypothetical protein
MGKSPHPKRRHPIIGLRSSQRRRGFYHFNFWHKLIAKKVEFITRIKKGAAIQIEQVFTDSYGLVQSMELNYKFGQRGYFMLFW